MILDERTEFADAQTVDAAAATETVLGDVIDQGDKLDKDGNSGASQYPGAGRTQLFVVVTGAVTRAAGGTLTLEWKSHTTNALASGTQHAAITIAQADVVAGQVLWVLAIPHVAHARFIGLTYTNSGGSADGAVNAFLTHDPSKYVAQPDVEN